MTLGSRALHYPFCLRWASDQTKIVRTFTGRMIPLVSYPSLVWQDRSFISSIHATDLVQPVLSPRIADTRLLFSPHLQTTSNNGASFSGSTGLIWKTETGLLMAPGPNDWTARILTDSWAVGMERASSHGGRKIERRYGDSISIVGFNSPPFGLACVLCVSLDMLFLRRQDLNYVQAVAPIPTVSSLSSLRT